MSALDVVLVVAVSGVTSFLVSIRGQLRLLLPIRKATRTDPELIAAIMRATGGQGLNAPGQAPGTPPSAPRPPLQ